MKYFYSHIIEIETVVSQLDEIDLNQDQKNHLAYLVDTTIHHTVLDTIFAQLPVEEHAYFVEKLKMNPEDKEIMDFLISKLDNIENQIIRSVEELKKELHKDLKEAKVLALRNKKGENK